jgi:hypothetical protein
MTISCTKGKFTQDSLLGIVEFKIRFGITQTKSIKFRLKLLEHGLSGIKGEPFKNN